MGTMGGKAGFVFGFFLATWLIVPMIQLIMGDCFFEQGCGRYETVGLVAAVVAAFALATVPALGLRYAINRLAPRATD